MTAITHSPAWQALARQRDAQRDLDVRALFASDPTRAERFSLEFEDLFVDYSKNLVNGDTMARLYDLARQVKVFEWRDRMMSGEKINVTEGRAVLHVALRNRSNRPIVVDGSDVMPEVNAVLAKMRKFTDAVRSGAWPRTHRRADHRRRQHRHRRQATSASVMASTALKPYWQQGLRAHFVSNVDGTHIAETVADLSAEHTLFIIESKTSSPRKRR